MNRGEVPGYEFEVPRGPRDAGGPRHSFGHDPLRQPQRVQPEQPPRSSVHKASSGVISVMRTRNWLMGLAIPILAAVAVGIAVVVVSGGGGSGASAPSALAAGFPPARLARASVRRPAGRIGGNTQRGRRRERNRGGGGRRERRPGALVLRRRRCDLGPRDAG